MEEYLPLAQAEQISEPNAAKLPGEQHTRAPAWLTFPAVQVVQFDAPRGAYCPSWQQTLAPEGLDFPASHVVQTLFIPDFACPYLPALQDSQELESVKKRLPGAHLFNF